MKLLNVGISKEKGPVSNASIDEPNSSNSFQITIVRRVTNEQNLLEFENLVNEMIENGFSINLRGYLSDIKNKISKNDFTYCLFHNSDFWNNCY